jgi:hypothetical protein
LYGVKYATATGFTILIADPAEAEITFSYSAVSVEDPRTTEGSSSSASAIPFPVTENGVPLSGNAIWNSCISGYPLILASGEPVNCNAYHEGFVWQHPDLLISFTYRPNAEPPVLELPEGYIASIVTASSSSVSSSASSEASSESSVSSSESSSESNESSSSSESSESSSSSESSESSSSSASSESSSSSESSEASSESSSSSSEEGGSGGGE